MGSFFAVKEKIWKEWAVDVNQSKEAFILLLLLVSFFFFKHLITL